MKRTNPEFKFQVQLVAMLRWILQPHVMMRHYPAGEIRDKRTAAKLKAMGTMPGCADLEFHWMTVEPTGTRRHVLWLELKAGKNKPTASQLVFAVTVGELGDEYRVARSVDEALKILGDRGLLRSHQETGVNYY